MTLHVPVGGCGCHVDGVAAPGLTVWSWCYHAETKPFARMFDAVEPEDDQLGVISDGPWGRRFYSYSPTAAVSQSFGLARSVMLADRPLVLKKGDCRQGQTMRQSSATWRRRVPGSGDYTGPLQVRCSAREVKTDRGRGFRFGRCGMKDIRSWERRPVLLRACEVHICGAAHGGFPGVRGDKGSRLPPPFRRRDVAGWSWCFNVQVKASPVSGGTERRRLAGPAGPGGGLGAWWHIGL